MITKEQVDRLNAKEQQRMREMRDRARVRANRYIIATTPREEKKERDKLNTNFYYNKLLREIFNKVQVKYINGGHPEIMFKLIGKTSAVWVKSPGVQLTPYEEVVKAMLEEKGIKCFVFRGQAKFMENVVKVLVESDILSEQFSPITREEIDHAQPIDIIG